MSAVHAPRNVMWLLGTALVGVAMTGCATMAGTNGNLQNTGDAWFIRNVSFFGMVTDSSIWYCPSSDELGPGVCTEALVDQAPARRTGGMGDSRGRAVRGNPSLEAMGAAPAGPTVSAGAPAGTGLAADAALVPAPTVALPDRPSRETAMAQLALVNEAVGACIERRPATVTVHVVFTADGRVRDVGVLAPRVMVPVEQCLIRAVGAATVPAFSSPSFELTYQYRVQ
jgi:hypothetical protein